MALSPDTVELLRDLARKLDAAPHGGQTSLVKDMATFLGWSPQTVWRQLKAAAGWQSGRKARSDKGSTSVSEQALVTLGAAQREAIRENGKQTLFTTTARGVLENNGIDLNVSTSQLNRLLKDRKLNVSSQRAVNPVQPLRAPHPNHTHEVDPSLCLVYYLKGKQYIMRDSEFYKNKLENMAKIKFKVWRYVKWDAASSVIVPWYVEAAGESQANLFDFLMFAWGKQEGRLNHGIPKFLLWDKGSANTSAAIKNMLRALNITPLEHQAGNARAKGGVENGNNIVETQFESRLKFEPVDSIEALNAAAFAWANAYNANLIPGQDTRLHRIGLAEPTARFDLWQQIKPEELVILPPVEVCRAYLTNKEEPRKVKGDLTITYKHPQAERTAQYSLRNLDGVNVGDEVMVSAMLLGDCAIRVAVPVYNGEDRIYQVEPERNFDQFGQLQSAAVIGEEFKAIAQTGIEHAAQAMNEQAWAGMSEEEIKAARAKHAAPFNGEIKAHSYLQDIELPTYLPRRGTEHDLSASKIELPPYSLVEAAKIIKSRIGDAWIPDTHYPWLAQRYTSGVPQDAINGIVAELTGPQAGHKRTLKVIGGNDVAA